MLKNESRKKALVIAVSDYDENSNLKNLPFCKNDGNEMLALLKSSGYKIMNVDGLIGQVDGRLMQDCVYSFFKDDDIKSDDTILFYFSGHGVPGEDDFFLASSNIDPKRPKMRGFSFEDLNGEITHCHAKRVIVILDSCYAGSLNVSGKSNELALASAAKNQLSATFKEGEGRCMLSSCMGFQESFATTDGTHSFFTNYLLKGLSGADGKSVDDNGIVTPESLMSYIDHEIDDLKGNRPVQTPFRKIESAGKIMLAKYPQYAKIETAVTKLTIDEHLKSLLKEGKIEEYNNLKKQNPNVILDLLDGLELSPEVDLRNVDFRNAKIAGFDFSKKDLHGAVFYTAQLTEVNFSESNLESSEFFGAIIVNSTFINANLKNAKLVNAMGNPNFENADLQNANLEGANLTGSNFKNAKLNGASCRGTNLSLCNFECVDFHGKTQLVDTVMKQSILSNANLEGLYLMGLNLNEAYLEGANFRKVKFEDVSLRKSVLKKANMSESDLKGVNLENSDLSYANLKEANLERAVLSESNLEGANLEGANFRGADLRKANLAGANMTDTYLIGADLIGANLKNTNLLRARLDRADLKDTNLKSADWGIHGFSGAKITGADLSGSLYNPPASRLKKVNLDKDEHDEESQ